MGLSGDLSGQGVKGLRSAFGCGGLPWDGGHDGGPKNVAVHGSSKGKNSVVCYWRQFSYRIVCSPVAHFYAHMFLFQSF